ncbi:MAG: tRNA (adenosine(37)-N6)-threonylcarbamoyltransferase complex dimerization subunit type 1 TsaB [Spirochaetaceae bacterium]|nr:MAG: tRNA (adenosine(37)-N6)-threonylcarbamoyltransferase complex dimerization subunit type 1 TsaB [Spirochaetaceae bacterium]
MSSYILAFDTSGPFLDIVLRNDDTMYAHAVDVGRGHGEAVGPAVRDLLLRADIPVSALSAVIVPRGPGSFTGLRIAISFAKGLQAAHDVPVYAVDTLRAMIRARYRAVNTPCTVLSVIDGRKDRLYAACERIDSQGVHHRLFGPVDEGPELLKQRLHELGIEPESLIVTGDGIPPERWAPYPQAQSLAGGVAEALSDLYLERDALVTVLEENEGPAYYRVSQAEEPRST